MTEVRGIQMMQFVTATDTLMIYGLLLSWSFENTDSSLNIGLFSKNISKKRPCILITSMGFNSEGLFNIWLMHIHTYTHIHRHSLTHTYTRTHARTCTHATGKGNNYTNNAGTHARMHAWQATL